MEKMKKVLSGNKAIPVTKRVERLIQFLSNYEELWYDNGKSLEDKINLIASDEDEKTRIEALYKQAEDDYTALRIIRSRYLDYKKDNRTTPFYRVTEEDFEALRRAGVGRTFGLSDENQAEYDRLAKAGIDEEVLRFIFRKYSNYNRFKEAYCEAMLQGKEQDIIKKCNEMGSYIVSEIDLSIPNGIRIDDRHYIDLLRDMLGVPYFVFDGTKLVSTIDAVIDFDIDRSRFSLTEKERDVVRKIYGLGVERMSSKEISRQMKVSNARIRQILSNAMEKLSNRKKQLISIVFLSDQREVAKFLVNYFKKNDIFRLEYVGQEIKQEENEIPALKGVNGNEESGLTTEMYTSVLAKNLKEKMLDLDVEWADVCDKLKLIYDGQLDRFEQINLHDYRLRGIPIDQFELSRRTYNCLTKNNISTIGDIITFSRNSKYAVMLKIDNMGEKSYNEIIKLMSMLGLKLEDEDKSEKTRSNNENTLDRMCKDDATAFYLYLEQIRCNVSSSIMQNSYKDDLDSRIDSIKESYGIYLSDEDTVSMINSRMDELGRRFDYDTSISVLKIPKIVVNIFETHGIKKVLDIYRLRDRDVSYIKRFYGAYFDLIVSELNRMGLQYPLLDKAPSNMMKHATYLNKTNIELITFLIMESNLDNETKDKLKRQLLKRINQVESEQAKDVDEELSKKIDMLKSAYNMLDSKENKLAKLIANQDKVDSDPDDDFDL